LSKKFRVAFMCVALGAILSGLLLMGCSSGSTSSTTAPAMQDQQAAPEATQSSGQSAQSGQQGQPPSGQGKDGMKNVIAKAATILGVSETDLTAAWESAMKEAGGGQGGPGGPGGSDNRTPPSPPSDNPPSGTPPSGQSGQQGQPPSGSSEMMTKVYASVATTLGLTTEKVQAAFEQAQSELKQ